MGVRSIHKSIPATLFLKHKYTLNYTCKLRLLGFFASERFRRWTELNFDKSAVTHFLFTFSRTTQNLLKFLERCSYIKIKNIKILILIATITNNIAGYIGIHLSPPSRPVYEEMYNTTQKITTNEQTDGRPSSINLFFKKNM